MAKIPPNKDVRFSGKLFRLRSFRGQMYAAHVFSSFPVNFYKASLASEHGSSLFLCRKSVLFVIFTPISINTELFKVHFIFLVLLSFCRISMPICVCFMSWVKTYFLLHTFLA